MSQRKVLSSSMGRNLLLFNVAAVNALQNMTNSSSATNSPTTESAPSMTDNLPSYLITTGSIYGAIVLFCCIVGICNCIRGKESQEQQPIINETPRQRTMRFMV